MPTIQNGSESRRVGADVSFFDIAVRVAYIADGRHGSQTLLNAPRGSPGRRAHLRQRRESQPSCSTCCIWRPVARALLRRHLHPRARSRHHHSALGRELDSLADIISFGVAPAVLAFASGLRGAWDWLALIYFVCCGVSRLARCNVTAETLAAGGDKVAYFEGTPIPTTFLLTALLAMAAWQGRLGQDLSGGAWTIGFGILHPLSLLFVLSGSLMISKTLRIPKI
jgi:CDP-diacylglycerol--serine O-phosphatidyltransferase